MKIDYAMTAADATAAIQELVWRHNRAALVLVGLIIVGADAVACAVVWFIAPWPTGLVMFALLLPTSLYAAMLIQRHVAQMLISKATPLPSNDAASLTNWSLELAPDGVRIATNLPQPAAGTSSPREALVSWQKVEAIIDGRRFAHVLGNRTFNISGLRFPELAFSVPRRAFADPREFEEFVASARRYLENWRAAQGTQPGPQR